MSFPLFDSLFKATEDKKNIIIDYDTRLKLGEDIKKLCTNAHEYVYALIRKFSLELDSGIIDTLPYEPKVYKNGYKFEVCKLPNRLVIMLIQFVELEMKRSDDDSERGNFFKN